MILTKIKDLKTLNFNPKCITNYLVDKGVEMSFNTNKDMGQIIDEKVLWFHFLTTMTQMIQMMNQTLGGVIAVREVIEVKIRSNIQNPEGKGKAREN